MNISRNNSKRLKKELEFKNKLSNMKEQLDLVKILKDCPSGMELDCTMYDNVTLKSVSNDINNTYPICIKTKSGFSTKLTKYGQNIYLNDAKCVIFPKGKTSWEGFQRPFKEGDFVATENGYFIGIIKSTNNTSFETYCAINDVGSFTINTPYYFGRFATEEEKQKLLNVIKANGYKWNNKTKTLEKLIVPKFKVGNSIQSKTDNNDKFTITNIDNNEFYYGYGKGHEFMIPVVKQDNWELIPYKFDPKTLKPFDKVLVRTHLDNNWFATFFSHINYPATFCYKFVTTSGLSYKYMIHYNEETECLLCTNNEAPEYYRC